MLTVVIPTHDNEEALAYALSALVPAAADGVISEVVVVDAGSEDGTLVVADAAGCLVVRSKESLGRRLKAGAEAGRRGRWLMFLSPDAVLEPGWHREAAAFVERAERSGVGRAAVFRFALDELGLGARFAEWRVAAGRAIHGLPAAEQGLLVPRRLYEALGGHRDVAGLAEADLARRVGRGRLSTLKAEARVGSRRLRRRDGALAGFAMLALRLPPAFVARRTV